MNQKSDEITIDLGKLLQFYLHHWLSLTLSGIVAAAAAFLITSLLLTPRYKADVTIYVNNTKSTQPIDAVTGANLSTAKQLVNTYVNIIKSDTVLKDVIAKGNFYCSVKDIRDSMTAEQIEDTEMFTVTISDSDARMAAKIANTIADVAPERISEFVVGSSTKIIDYAKIPQTPYTPSYPKNVILGGVLGIILMGAVLTFRFLFNMRIEDEDDVRNYLNVPVLGMIPDYGESSKKRPGKSVAGKGGK